MLLTEILKKDTNIFLKFFDFSKSMNNLANIDNRLRMILKNYKLKTKINIKDKKISVAFLNMP